jgi:hypothetical protein
VLLRDGQRLQGAREGAEKSLSSGAARGQARAGGSGGSSTRDVEKERCRTVEGSNWYDPAGAGQSVAGRPRAADLTIVHPGAEAGSLLPSQGAEPTHGPVYFPEDGFSGTAELRGVSVGGRSDASQQQESPRHSSAHLQ